jgi:hypothetical protein
VYAARLGERCQRTQPGASAGLLLGAPSRVTVHAVEVLAIGAEAQGFYRKYGFLPLTDDELHLFLPIETVRDGFAQAAD